MSYYYHPFAEAVLQQAYKEAQKSNSESIADWHLLRAIWKEDGCAGARVLEAHGIENIPAAKFEEQECANPGSKCSDEYNSALDRAHFLSGPDVDTCDFLQSLASGPRSEAGEWSSGCAHLVVEFADKELQHINIMNFQGAIFGVVDTPEQETTIRNY